MSPGKIWMMKCALVLIPAFALATPTFAHAQQETESRKTLNDPSEPGSAIVFPYFLKGTVPLDGVMTYPKTEIEVGIVCPEGEPDAAVCAEGQRIKIRFHWVCPGSQDFASKLICKETNFDVFGSVNGKLVFNPEALTIAGSNTVTVPQAPCNAGYLVGYVIRPSDDQPIKFDGLIGDAVIRESATAVSAYNAIPIQANPDDALNSVLSLTFDGASGNYQAVTGEILADVKFDNLTTSFHPVINETYLVLLTLDVRSNRSNLPTTVDLFFHNESLQSGSNPLWERLLSTSTEFVCWTRVPLSGLDPNLTMAGMGSRKGIVQSDEAEKFPWAGIQDDVGRVTLLGLVETLEAGGARSYINSMYNFSDPVPTSFDP
jgi:hypothetical protein